MFKITKKFFFFFVAFTIVLSTWIIYYKPSSILYFFLILVGILLIFRFEIKALSLNFKKFIPLFLFLFYCWLPKRLFFDQLSFGLLISLFYSSLLIALPKSTQKEIFKNIKVIFLWILLPGIVFFVLNNYLNVFNLTPIAIVEVEERVWAVFPFYVSDITNTLNNIRFSSIFDEPGYLGTLMFFILLIDNFSINKTNLIFFISGVLSFSLAFYLLTCLYVLFKLIIEKKVKTIFLIIAIAIVLNVMFYETIQSLILGRIMFDSETRTIVGDNRGGLYLHISALGHLYEHSPITFMFGNGLSVIEYTEDPYGVFSDSVWVRLVYQIGIIPLISFLIYLFHISTLRTNRFDYFLFFTISLYQRPQIFEPVILFLLFYGIRKYNYNSSHKLKTTEILIEPQKQLDQYNFS